MTSKTNGQAIITVQQLHEKQACEAQVELFQQIWGERVDVEEEEFLKHADKFDWAWAADCLLPASNRFGVRGYSAWNERYSEHARLLSEAYLDLKEERRREANAVEESKYYDVFDSYEGAVAGADKARRKAIVEGQAIWFARLYREACGITTDEWQVKERAARAAEATDIEDELAPEDDPEQEQV